MGKFETIQVGFEIREANSDTGYVRGYASVFNQYTEAYHEVVAPGAFTKTIKESKGILPVFKAHNMNVQLGHGISAAEDDYGLDVEGNMLINDIPEARAEFALIKQAHELGKPRGLSFGFIALQEKQIEFKHKGKVYVDVRQLQEVKLLEWSPVPFPAYDRAGIKKYRNYDYSFNLNMVMQLISRFEPEEKSLLIRALQADLSGAELPPEPNDIHSLQAALEKVVADLKL